MRKIVGEKRILFKGKFTLVNEFDLKDDDKDEILKYECVDRGNSVSAIVFNRNENVYYFVKQFRVGAQKELVELVAGMLDENENPEDAVSREIEEELGFTIQKDKTKLLFTFYTSPGGLAEKSFLYYTETDKRLNTGGGIEDEAIQILSLTKEQIRNTIFEDAKTLVGVQYLLSVSQ